MKKKILLIAMTLSLSIGLIGCSNKETPKNDFISYETSSLSVEEKYDGKCIFLTSMEDYKNKCPELNFSGIQLNDEFFEKNNAFIAYTIVNQENVEFTVYSSMVNKNDSNKIDVIAKLFTKGNNNKESIESRSILVVTDKNITDVNFICE